MNLLIVDDELLEVTVIEQMIDRKKFGIVEVYHAYRMNQAIDILAHHSVSILLTDIEMPGGSGLQLIEWVRSKNLDIVPILLSCHAKFEYAQQALMLQVREYLLKPIQKEDLEKALSLAIDSLKKQQENKQNEQYAEYWKQENHQNGMDDFSQSGNIRLENTRTQDFIKKIQQYILKNPEKDLNRTTLASHVYLHPDYLSHTFKAQTGMSLSDYIIQVRINCAKNLLLKTNMSISEISMRCAYENTAYFTKLFKNVVHMPPKEYRKSFSKTIQKEFSQEEKSSKNIYPNY